MGSVSNLPHFGEAKIQTEQRNEKCAQLKEMVRQADLYAVSLPISQLIKERVEQGTEGSKGREKGEEGHSPVVSPSKAR